MSEEKRKVIFVSEKIDAKIPDQLRAKLDEMGVEVEIVQKAPVAMDLVDEIFVETMKETLKMEVLLEEDLKKQDEESKSKRYVPKKIGDERKKKIKNVRGKRYGR